MVPAGELQSLVEVWLPQTALLAIVRAVKYQEVPRLASPSLEDHALSALISLAFVALSALARPWLGLACASLGVALLSALWLDAALYRVFTIELGPGGAAGVELSTLYREFAGVASGRRFFAAHRAFCFLPLAALAAYAPLALDPGSRARDALLALLTAYVALATAQATALPRGFGAALAVGMLGCAGLRWGARVPLDASVVNALAGAWPVACLATLAGGGPPRHGPSLIRDFLRPRPLPIPRGFRPRPEHERLVSVTPAPPRPSPLHGRLRGADVILLTFESLGRDHLAAFAPGGASTPHLDRLLARSVRSLNHFCPSPTTNNAHLVLYGSNPTAAQGLGGLRALADAGYETVYLTTAVTAHYGLRGLLTAAGFHHILDGEAFERPPAAPLTDGALVTQGARLVAPLLRRGPFFLHVHAANTHLPYLVVDRARFCRHDPGDDRGRFLNAIEEADLIFAELLRALREAGVGRAPLLIVSSDHGQSFGERGYRSHGSAVTREQIMVPLLLHHPDLEPRAVRASSHLDVLPTALDLLGLTSAHPGLGDSIFHEDREVRLVLWDGHPSRTTTSSFGFVLGDRKIMVDLVRGTCHATDWDDAGGAALEGAEAAYFSALAAHALQRRGIT